MKEIRDPFPFTTECVNASRHFVMVACPECDYIEPREPLSTGPNEVRVTDPLTGGQKNQKLAQIGAVDPLALIEVAKVAGFGAQKYARLNFLKGYAWSLSYDALQRHLMAFWSREDDDPESSLSHLAHAAWHCLALLAFVLRGRGTDDRPG